MVSRQTKQKELLDAEVRVMKQFFSAEDLYARVSRKDAKLGIATVYRFLKEKVVSGELFSYRCNRRTIYSTQESHCHFICERTGKVVHFAIDSLDFLSANIPGSISSFQLEVRGVCSKEKH